MVSVSCVWNPNHTKLVKTIPAVSTNEGIFRTSLALENDLQDPRSGSVNLPAMEVLLDVILTK